MNKWMCILALFLALPLFGNAQQKRAFLVGISNYHSNGYKVWNNIHGAEDVALLTPELEKKGFHVQILTNEQATYQGIVDSLEKLIATSKKGDIIYIHFSCHGQPVEDGLKGDTFDEEDLWDESIIPIDAGKTYDANGYKGEKHFTDDEFNVLSTNLRKKIGPAGMLYITIDACHAGTIERGGMETIRGTKDGFCSTPDCKYLPPESNSRHYSVEQGKGMSPVLFVEACKAYEYNSEIIIKGKEYGALSYNIWHALKDMPSLDKDTKDLFKAGIDASTKIKGRWPRTQTLVIEE